MTLRALQVPVLIQRHAVRGLSTTSRVFVARAPANKKTSNVKRRNEAIPYQLVRLSHPDTGLSPLQPLADLLARRKTAEVTDTLKKRLFKEAVELVVEEPQPIVRFVDLSAEYHRKKEQRKQQSGKAKDKEIQMTWNVSDGDLAHKLRKAREALEDGQRVHIAYTGKKGKPRPTHDEMQAKLAATVTLLSDVGKEQKARAVMPPATVVIYLEPLNLGTP